MVQILNASFKLVRISSRTGMRGKKLNTTFREWVMRRESRLADSTAPAALAKVSERKYAEDYQLTSWDPRSGRTARPAIGSDGKSPAIHFMSQDLVNPTMDRSAWELGFESPTEMYPDAPTDIQPDIWLVRRIQPKYNPRMVNRKGKWLWKMQNF